MFARDGDGPGRAPMLIDPNDLAQTAVPTFSEDFNSLDLWNGTSGLDTAGGPHWGSSVTATGTRPYNQEQEWYVRADAAPLSDGSTLPNPFSVHDGVLTITANPTDPHIASDVGGQPYTSGMVNTAHAFSQTYGYFEMRAELPAGHGLWPAFWLLPADGSWPPEIDVMEMLGNAPGTLYTTVHSLAPGETPATHDVHQGVASVADMSSGYHTYGVDWEADNLTFYFDGQEVYHTPTPPDLDRPMYMIANLAVGGNWPGNPDGTTHFPAQMNIDYIRAYQPSAQGSPVLDPVYHFYDAATGQHFYTASSAERDYVNASQPNYIDQGVGWAAPEAGPNTEDVFRFVDPATGDHVYTASPAERASLEAPGSTYHSDGVAFQAYTNPTAAGSDSIDIEQFVNTESGQHYYASSAAEIASIDRGHAGAGWVDDGLAFIVHAPAADMHGL